MSLPLASLGDTGGVSPSSQNLPSPDEWLHWKIQIIDELPEGKQSRVLHALIDGTEAAVKLTSSRMADRDLLTARLRAVESLGAGHSEAVAPIRIHGALVQPIGGWFMTATPFITGHQLDASNPRDAKLLGQQLARLHEALAGLGPFEIPPIAALNTTGRTHKRAGWQLLHGDFSTSNVVATPTMLRVFDFDDCGYGPVEYDVANSLYMELFDSDVTDRPDHYQAFRPAFLNGYVERLSRPIDMAAVDEMMAIRIEALGHWLKDLSSAPIGIRTSPPEWLETLASFVQRHGSASPR